MELPRVWWDHSLGMGRRRRRKTLLLLDLQHPVAMLQGGQRLHALLHLGDQSSGPCMVSGENRVTVSCIMGIRYVKHMDVQQSFSYLSIMD